MELFLEMVINEIEKHNEGDKITCIAEGLDLYFYFLIL